MKWKSKGTPIISEEKGEWIDINDRKPKQGQLVIAVGQCDGETSGLNDESSMEVGFWYSDYVSLSSDYYSLQLINVTHWQPAPDMP